MSPDCCTPAQRRRHLPLPLVPSARPSIARITHDGQADPPAAKERNVCLQMAVPMSAGRVSRWGRAVPSPSRRDAGESRPCSQASSLTRSGPQPGFRKGEAAGQTASGSPVAHGSSNGYAPEQPRGAGSLCGLPPDLVDELLAVYFTHVHVSDVYLSLDAPGPNMTSKCGADSRTSGR
jgi:hypothetical protein